MISQFKHPAFLLGQDLHLKSANPAAREWLMLAGDQTLDWDKGLGHMLRPLAEKCLQTKAPQEDIFSGEHEGRIHPRLLTLQYLEDNGKTTILGQSFPMTEKSLEKLDQESLVTSERVALALRSRRVGFWDWNLKDDILRWDRTQWEIFGYTPGAFDNPMQAFSETLDPVKGEVFWREIREAIEGERPYNTEFEIVTPDRDRRIIRGSGICFWDENGKPSRLIGLNWDVTHRRKLQAQANEQARMLQKITEMMPAFITIGNIPEDRMKFFNKRYIEIFELDPEDVRKQPFSSWQTRIHPEEVPKLEGHRERIFALADNEIADITMQTIDHQGNPRWLRIQTQVFERDSEGRPTELITVGVDITEERRLASAAESDRAKAFNSSKHAALGQMAGGIAHEVNNPLTIIIAKVEQIRKSISSLAGVDPKVNEDIDRIVQMCQRIAKIIRSMRTVSRIEETEVFQRASLHAVVDDVLILCHQRLANLKIDLRVGKIPDTQVDLRPVQVSQILLNLLNNSVDAVTDLPEKWIDLEFLETKSHMKICITDSGQGIQSDIAHRMMEPFFTTKAVGKGTGLGLSISLSLAELHGGTLSYDTTSKQTRFVFQFPKHQQK